MSQVHEGDYDGLIKVMEFLSLVANRQKATDTMFDPLQEVIDLLRQYGMAIPNESLAQLEDHTERSHRRQWVKCLICVKTVKHTEHFVI